MSEIAVIREGRGPELLLVHGGASPRATWGALAPLAERWTLAHVHRRGYPPSPPPPGGRQDFEVDARDVEPLLDGSRHVVAHSYGVVGMLIAAARRPDRVPSLTLIEPPLYGIAREDPAVARVERMGNEVLGRGLDADPRILREFLALSGAPELGDGPLPEPVADGVRRAHGGRVPGEASLDLAPLRAARVPVLVVSGDHDAGLERICDVLAGELRAQRLVAPGAGHSPHAAPGFAGPFERFVRAAASRGGAARARDAGPAGL